jgi:hypothetical protein
VGTGNFSLEGDTTSTYAISGTGINTGTITIGGGTGAQTLNIMSSTGVKTVNIANGAAANVVTIGTVTGAASLALKAGTGNFTLEGDVATTYTISGTGANTGTINISTGSGAQTTNIGVNAAGVKTINIGTGAVANVVSIGSSTGAASLNLIAGSGDVSVTSANLKIATTGKMLQIKGGAATDSVGTFTLVAGTATVADTNIATGDRIFISRIAVNASTALGETTYTISNGASFTVTAMGVTTGTILVADVSTFAYFIIRPL